MPLARFLPLLITLLALVGAPASAHGCAVPESRHAERAEARVAAQWAPNRAPAATSTVGAPEAGTATRSDNGAARAGWGTADVGESSTSTVSGALTAGPRGGGGLLSFLSRALADTDEEPDDEFEAGDAPDLVDDDCPQGFAVVAFSGLSMPRLTALYVEPNVWGIQPSIGHPQGVDEPPRI